MKSRTNYHEFIDKAGASLGALVYRNSRFFGTSLESETIRSAIGSTRVETAGFQPGIWQDVMAYGLDDQFQTAYLVHRWEGFHVPTLLYIHGSGEHPKDFGQFSDNSFRRIFAEDTESFKKPLNLILLMAPFHAGSQHAYIHALGHLKNYVGMLASTTVLLETLASQLRQEGCPEVNAAGFSLGGWVVNLHRAFFGKHIDRYIPLCAGTRPEAVFLTSHYRKLTAESARKNPALLRASLNFEAEFRANKTPDCLPLLFRYDRLVELEEQLPGYQGLDVRIVDKGHFTGQQATGELRKHIFNALA